MQDDVAMEKAFERAMYANEPFYTGYTMKDGTMCLRDETARFPDKPEGCYAHYQMERNLGVLCTCLIPTHDGRLLRSIFHYSKRRTMTAKPWVYQSLIGDDVTVHEFATEAEAKRMYDQMLDWAYQRGAITPC